MKKYIAGLFSALAVTIFVAAPVSALAHNGGTPYKAPKLSKASIQKCEKQADLLARTPADLEYFKQSHYSMPSATDLAAYYPINKIGVQQSVYKGPDKARQGAVNYTVSQQRFEGAYFALSHVYWANSSDLALDTNEMARLRDAIANNQAIINQQISAIDQKKIYFSVVPPKSWCADSATRQKVVADMTKQRSAIIAQFKKDLRVSSQATQEAHKIYKKLEAQSNSLVRKNLISYRPGR